MRDMHGRKPEAVSRQEKGGVMIVILSALIVVLLATLVFNILTWRNLR